MKKMLVTGGSGFLGSRVVRFFESKYRVFAPTHRQMDITNRESVLKTVEGFQPDVVIHCAAMSDVGQCQREPQVSWERNVTGSIHVAEAARLAGAVCLLCSSDQVYFATETNLYARQKRTAEVEGLAVNPNCVFLRLSWMYDPALTSTSQRSDFFTNLLQKLRSEECVSYPVHDKRGITDVNEVIRNMEKAMALPGGVYHFGSPNDKTMYETAVSIFTGLGQDPGRVLENREAFRDNPRDMTMDQRVINSYGIFFSDTTEALVRNFANHPLT